jgi:hypothetical protein
MPTKGRRRTDHDAELIRQMYEEIPPGMPGHMGCRRLAEKFELSRSAVRKIVRYVTYRAPSKPPRR